MKYKKKTYIIDENASELEKFCYNNATKMSSVRIFGGDQFVYFEFAFAKFELNVPVSLDTGAIVEHDYMELISYEYCENVRIPFHYTAEQALEQLKLIFASEGVKVNEV